MSDERLTADVAIKVLAILLQRYSDLKDQEIKATSGAYKRLLSAEATGIKYSIEAIRKETGI